MGGEERERRGYIGLILSTPRRMGTKINTLRQGTEESLSLSDWSSLLSSLEADPPSSLCSLLLLLLVLLVLLSELWLLLVGCWWCLGCVHSCTILSMYTTGSAGTYIVSVLGPKLCTRFLQMRKYSMAQTRGSCEYFNKRRDVRRKGGRSCYFNTLQIALGANHGSALKGLVVEFSARSGLFKRTIALLRMTILCTE
jgi:hypothetical protein